MSAKTSNSEPAMPLMASAPTLCSPVVVLSLGAGVQSSTLALMAAHGEVEPMPDAAIFADTQAEPQSVYRWLDWLEKELPFPVHRVTVGNLEERELRLVRSAKSGRLYRKSGVPLYMQSPNGNGSSNGIIQRKCTRDFKLDPLKTKMRELGAVPRGCKEIRVITWIGISLDEVIRMKPSPHPWAENQWPLIEKRMSRHDCKEWMRKKGYPEPPRSACRGCPYHSDAEWRRLKSSEPDEFRKAVLWERAIQEASERDETTEGIPFLHASRIPLDQVDFSTDEERGQLSLFGNECEGMCGV